MIQTERLTVAQFNRLLNLHIQQVGLLIVEGEIIQLNITQKGGVSIELKDPLEQASVRVSGYAPQIQGINSIREGMQVAVWGTPEIWEQRGLFSLKANKILPVGEGELKEAYEQLKNKLAQEGLFSEERKRELPRFITRIALITARGSAAQSDFLKILRENRQNIEIDFYNAYVQGKSSEIELINALKQANLEDYDCIVLVRGGGSLEDLISFNDEQLARTIFASKVPVIAGVGHERDETIAEYVADKRASTPSQAAYYLISRNEEFLNNLNFETRSFHALLAKEISRRQLQLESDSRTINAVIINYLAMIKAGVNDSQKTILFAISKISSGIKSRLESAVNASRGRLEKIFSSSLQKLLLSRQKLQRVPELFRQQLKLADTYERLLLSYNPANVLKRGYTLVKNEEGRIVTGIAGLKEGSNITVTMKNGSLYAKILKLLKQNDNN